MNDQMAAIDTDRLSQGINNVMAAIIPRLKNFHNLLVTPPKVGWGCFCALLISEY